MSKHNRPRSAVLIAVFVLAGTLLGIPGARAQDPDKELKFKKQDLEKALFQLTTSDEEIQYSALEKLRELGFKEEAFGGIVSFAERTRYPHLAHHAGVVLHALDPAGAFEVVKARARGGAKTERVARNRLILLWELGTEPAVSLMLSQFTNDTRKSVRVDLVRAIGELKIRSASGLLTKALTLRDTDIRNQAAISVGKLGDPALAPALVAALDDTDGFHNMFAAWALGRIADPAVFDHVSQRLPPGKGKVAAAKAVSESASQASHVERLIGLLKNNRIDDYRIAACRGLGRVAKGNAEAMSVLFKVMLGDRDPIISAMAFHALSRIVDETFVPELLKRMGQRDPAKLRFVFELAGDLKVTEAAPRLMSRVFSEKRDEFVWKTAAVNLWRIDHRATNDRFEKYLDRASGAGAMRAIDALGFRKNERGFRFLSNLLRKYPDGSSEQRAVEMALERMTGHLFGPQYGVWRRWFEQHPDFFSKTQQELDRKKWREDFDKEGRGFRQTDETEAAVQRGLRWLARHQDADGAWDPNKYYDHDPPDDPGSRDGARIQLDPVGTTALGVLAFLGAGYSPDEGKYKDAISRGLEYVMARQQAKGDYLENDLVGGYNRPVALMALAEAYNITQDERYERHVQVGIDFLSAIQNSLGGWRYRVRIETTDSSCCSWNAFALKTAEKSGFRVREMVYEGIRMVFELYSSPVGDQREEFIEKKKGVDSEYGYSYDVGKGTNYKYWAGYQNNSYPDGKYATVPLGLMTRIFLGYRRTHPFCIGSANSVLEDFFEEIPAGEDWSKYRSRREYPTYAWYYGTIAMHQMGGRYFRRWNEVIKKIVPGTQAKDGPDEGSWPVWNHDMVAGRLYTTCMGILTLEAYYRYKPILEE